MPTSAYKVAVLVSQLQLVVAQGVGADCAAGFACAPITSLQEGDFVCNAWSNPRRREWPDGAVEHYEGERGVERLVSIVYPDGHIEDYEGEKDAERKVCVEWPDGPLEHYEGERGAERLVRMEWPDGQVDHYEGERDAEQTVRVERPSDDATIMSESYV